MASTNWPDGSPKSVDDNEYEMLGSAWSPDGVLGTSADSTPVFGDSTGRQVKFRAGKRAVVHGHGWAAGASDITVAVAANSSGQPRIDLAVLGLDRTTWLVTEYVKQGTPGASPVAPTPQRDGLGVSPGKWELPLARIAVANGAATISAADVTSVAPFLGPQQMLYVASKTVLDTLPGVSAGQLAHVADQITSGDPVYQYTGSLWRRQDWNNSWGLVGGTKYMPTGPLGPNEYYAYAYGAATDTGIRSGTVSLLAGRRYGIEFSSTIGFSATGDAEAYIAFDVLKVGGASVLANPFPLNQHPCWGTWLQQWTVDYQPTTDESVNFALQATAVKSTGTTLNWAGFARGTGAFFRVRDNGPSGIIAAG